MKIIYNKAKLLFYNNLLLIINLNEYLLNNINIINKLNSFENSLLEMSVRLSQNYDLNNNINNNNNNLNEIINKNKSLQLIKDFAFTQLSEHVSYVSVCLYVCLSVCFID